MLLYVGICFGVFGDICRFLWGCKQVHLGVYVLVHVGCITAYVGLYAAVCGFMCWYMCGVYVCGSLYRYILVQMM